MNLSELVELLIGLSALAGILVTLGKVLQRLSALEQKVDKQDESFTSGISATSSTAKTDITTVHSRVDNLLQVVIPELKKHGADLENKIAVATAGADFHAKELSQAAAKLSQVLSETARTAVKLENIERQLDREHESESSRSLELQAELKVIRERLAELKARIDGLEVRRG